MSLLSLDVFWKLGMFSKNGLWVPPEDLAHPSEFGWNGTLYFTVGPVVFRAGGAPALQHISVWPQTEARMNAVICYHSNEY